MPKKRLDPRLLILMGFWLLVTAGCDREPQSRYIELTAGPQEQSMRLVTLAPALSQMIVDLGQARLLVGVARNDDAAPTGLPIVGDIMDVHSEALLATRPSHVLLMLTKEGVPSRLRDLSQRAGFQIIAYPSPTSIEEIGMVLLDETEFVAGLGDPTSAAGPGPGPQTAKPPSLGMLLHQPIRAQQVKLTMLMRLGKLGQLTAGEARPRVLLVLGTNPVMAVGPSTTHHQILTTLNAINAAGDATVGAPIFDREKLLEAAPEVIVFLSPKAAALGDWENEPRLAGFRGLAIPAVQNNRIALVSEPTTLLPSSSIDRVAAAMAKAIYPHLAQAIDELMNQDFFGSQLESDEPATVTAGAP